ncbi:nucleotidyl transferase AbiEii/AbiGii toxin family protein [Desulfotignum balticum]|uniref:nucleotidyl transferase AbiEii/AbiGii toxin family protein n=1 Tax=Desulfotignum balticum TaxID=115781 RepID=UPI000407B788|nr:nucleotidyl transferase AbiEii/AbiGii toxin family protein [Desulfotignum balticum]
MKLHLDKKLFQEAIQATAQHIGIPEVYVEKDYWVSLVLLEIFSSEISDLVVFKGGTCLSKCHNLIQRFSEDIDLVIIPVKGEPTNQFSKRMKMVSKIVEKILPETHIEGYTNKRGNIRKTVHQYDKVFDSNLVQVADHLILEASLLGNSEPFTKQKISSYLLDFMIHAGTEDLIKKHNMAAFNVQALSVKRTLCEKIMSLVRFSQVENRDVILSSKVRHIYDLHLMLKNEEILSFFNENDFIKMLVKVGEDDFVGYKNNNEWLKNHPGSAIIFDSPEKVWPPIMKAYQGSFKQMVYGELPSESDLLDTLGKISKRIKPIDWQVGR